MVLNPKTSRADAFKAVATVLLGLLVLGLFIVLLGGTRLWERYDEYVIRFGTVKDLRPGRTVKYAGLDVGRVLGLGVDPEDPARIRVVVGLDPDFTLLQGTVASIAQKGMVGDYFVSLDLEGAPGPRMDPGSTIPARSVADVQDVARLLGDLVGDLAPRLEHIASSLDRVLSDRNVENVSMTIERLPALVAEAEATLAVMREDWPRLSTAITSLAEQGGRSLDVLDTTLAATTRNIDGLTGELTVTMADIRARLAVSLGKIDTLTQTLGDDLAYDQERLAQALENVDSLAQEMRRLARSLRERPWQLLHKNDSKAVP